MEMLTPCALWNGIFCGHQLYKYCAYNVGIYKRSLSLPVVGVTFGHTLRFISFRGCGERLKRIKTKTGISHAILWLRAGAIECSSSCVGSRYGT